MNLAPFFVKIIFIPLLVVLAFPCTVEANWFGYGSLFEAFNACKSWIFKNTKKNSGAFSCRDDNETNQILALKNYSKVMKRFKY